MVVNNYLRTNNVFLELHNDIKQLEKKNKRLKLIIDYLEREIVQKQHVANHVAGKRAVQIMPTAKVIDDVRGREKAMSGANVPRLAINPVTNERLIESLSAESLPLGGFQVGSLFTLLAKVLNQFSSSQPVRRISGEGLKIQAMSLVPLLSLLLSSPLSVNLDNDLWQQNIAEDIPELGSNRAAVMAHITRRLLLEELSIQEAPQNVPAIDSASNHAEVSQLEVEPPTEEQAAPEFAPKTYIVKKDDTLLAISRRLDLSLEALIEANPKVAGNPNFLKIGESLTIPSGDSTEPSTDSYIVEWGDTLSKIAAQYGTTVDAIVAFNSNLPNANTILSVGQQLSMPTSSALDSSKSSPPDEAPPTAPVNPSQRAVGHFMWPTQGPITQQPGVSHMALDIAIPLGTPIIAADGGQVVTAASSTVGYGNYIVIDHGNGLRTLYAHLTSFNVQVGTSVSQGTVIGHSGSTGKSTGPHLHFEVRLHNILQNPWKYLN